MIHENQPRTNELVIHPEKLRCPDHHLSEVVWKYHDVCKTCVYIVGFPKIGVSPVIIHL